MSKDVENGGIATVNKAKLTDWASIYVAAALSFVGSVQFSVYFSALWSYMRLIDKGITEDFYGITVAVYSFGQAISSPAFGAWSNKTKQVTLPLTAGLILMLCGNIIYLGMELASAPRYVLLACRFITGIGSGNLAILRSYASTASHSMDRSRAIALVTCGQAIGMTIGPIFQYVFIQFEYPGVAIFNRLHLNLYTLPAYLAVLMNVIGMVCLYTLFVENYDGIIEENASLENKRTPSSRRVSLGHIPMYDITAVLVCYVTRFVDMFVRSQLETLGSPFAMMMFSLDETDAVRYLSITQGIIGIITVMVYMGYIFANFEKHIKFRKGCVASLLMMFIFHFITYAWPIWPKNVEIFENHGSPNGTLVGCEVSKFKWCNNLPTINIWFYYGAYIILIGISFPFFTMTLTTLFSKILGPIRQGTQQGFFQASSAVARMIGPVISSFMYSKKGPRPVWIMELIVLGLVLATWFVFYTRMVALKVPDSIRRLSRRISQNKH